MVSVNLFNTPVKQDLCNACYNFAETGIFRFEKTVKSNPSAYLPAARFHNTYT